MSDTQESVFVVRGDNPDGVDNLGLSKIWIEYAEGGNKGEMVRANYGGPALEDDSVMESFDEGDVIRVEFDSGLVDGIDVYSAELVN